MDPFFTPQRIVLGCVFLFLIYWTVSATNVKKTQEVQKNLWDFRIVIVIIAGIVVLLTRFHIIEHIPLLPIVIIPLSPVVLAVGIIFALTGFIIAIIARHTLGGNWSSNIDLKKNHTLMTTGIYGYMRHPIYTGTILMLLGLVCVIGNVLSILLTFLATWFLQYKIKQEEILLSRHFPKEYAAYKKRTKTLIPFIF